MVAEMSNTRKSYKWYVYELVDPRCGSVFYVGKGTGDRAKDHTRSAIAYRGCNFEKSERIRNILSDGKDVDINYVAYFCCEHAAYDYEAQRIASHSNLTNIARVPSSKRKRIVSFMPLITEIFGMDGDPTKQARQLMLFADWIDRHGWDDHKALFNAAAKVVNRRQEKSLLSQCLGDKVYG